MKESADISEMHYKVSVIVPIFNVRDYLSRCVECLMRQTLREIEFIFVEDCSQDDSYDVLTDTLSRFPERQQDVRIIRHEVNKGLSMSRSDGLDVASGDFIAHCDSDDWMDVTMYERMYSQAVSDNADICICDFFFVRKDGLERMHPAIDCTKPHEKLVYDYLVCKWNTVWSVLVARDVYERSGARPPAGITFTEDFYLTVRLFQYAGKVTSVNDPLYCYNQLNVSSIVHKIDIGRQLEELDCYERTISWFKEQGVYESYQKPMQWRLLKSVSYLVLHNRFEEFRNLDRKTYRYILSIPDSFCDIKTKIMLVLVLFRLDFICRWDNRRHGRCE